MHGLVRPYRVVVSSCSLALALATLGCGWFDKLGHVNSGNTLYNKKQYLEAIAEYEKAVAISPDAWTPNYRIATAYLELYQAAATPELKQTHGDAARKALERCTKLEAPDAETAQKVRDYYMGVLVVSGDPQTALALGEEQLARDPDNPELLTRLANLYMNVGDFPKALHYFERRAELEPDNADAWYSLGVMCWNRSYHGGNTVSFAERETVVAKGIAALEKAEKINPNSFDTLVYSNLLYRERAKVNTTLGRPQDAAQDLLKANEFSKRAQALKKAAG